MNNEKIKSDLASLFNGDDLPDKDSMHGECSIVYSFERDLEVAILPLMLNPLKEYIHILGHVFVYCYKLGYKAKEVELLEELSKK